MGRLGDIIEKLDGKFFREDYYYERHKYILLASFDTNNKQPDIEKIPLVPYEKIEELIEYIDTRDYAHRGPLRGIDLRLNGFSEIVDSFEMPVYRYPSEYCLAFKDDEIVNALKLINKLKQIECYHALLPYTDKRNDWVYMLYDSSWAGNIAKYCKEAKVYSDFLNLSKKMESNPYIDLEIDECPNLKLYFHTIYLTVARRPYLIFQQKSAGTMYRHNRSKPKYKLDECLELYDNPHEASGKPYPSVASVFDNLFAYPDDKESKVEKILNIYYSIFNKNINAKDVYYDWVKECYCFSPDIEDRMFSKYPITRSKSAYFCKYTSLNTLICILNSGKMRMNSIATMNDPTETEKLYSEGCNFICDNENTDDLKKFANNYYLTSFTSSQSEKVEEDLNMWRFYGDDAKGVCLVFEPLIEDHEVFEVNYDDLDSKELMDIETFLQRLKNEEDINFCIQSYVDKYLFIKPKEFKIEQESRLIIATIDQPEYTVYSNNIVTPYIDRRLTYKTEETGSSCNTTFPLKLTQIILGPEMKNKEINKLNLESMIHSKPLFRNKVSVHISKLKCYRQ